MNNTNAPVAKPDSLFKLTRYMTVTFAIALCYSMATKYAASPSVSTVSNTAINDTVAYHLGQEHAIDLIIISSDSTAVRSMLLDIRSRETSFRQKFGNDVADSYISGFEDMIDIRSDSLARILL